MSFESLGGSRAERNTMRQRGAGTRAYETTDFAFAFAEPTILTVSPVPGRRERSKTPATMMKSRKKTQAKILVHHDVIEEPKPPVQVPRKRGRPRKVIETKPESATSLGEKTSGEAQPLRKKQKLDRNREESQHRVVLSPVRNAENQSMVSGVLQKGKQSELDHGAVELFVVKSKYANKVNPPIMENGASMRTTILSGTMLDTGKVDTSERDAAIKIEDEQPYVIPEPLTHISNAVPRARKKRKAIVYKDSLRQPSPPSKRPKLTSSQISISRQSNEATEPRSYERTTHPPAPTRSAPHNDNNNDSNDNAPANLRPATRPRRKVSKPAHPTQIPIPGAVPLGIFAEAEDEEDLDAVSDYAPTPAPKRAAKRKRASVSLLDFEAGLTAGPRGRIQKGRERKAVVDTEHERDKTAEERQVLLDCDLDRKAKTRKMKRTKMDTNVDMDVNVEMGEVVVVKQKSVRGRRAGKEDGPATRAPRARKNIKPVNVEVNEGDFSEDELKMATPKLCRRSRKKVLRAKKCVGI